VRTKGDKWCGMFGHLDLEVGEHARLGRSEATPGKETTARVEGESALMRKSTVRILGHGLDGLDKTKTSIGMWFKFIGTTNRRG
jgi:hypothetical protein